MNAGTRILLNTVATYGRTMFAIALGLFSSRWVLAALGKVDYGLVGVVGALITFVTFLSGVSASACARFFALAIGARDSEELQRWFNTAVVIHGVLAIVLIGAGVPVGEWAISSFLNIPPDRLFAARWVMRCSLISAFWNIASAPYFGMFVAQQRMVEMSFWGVLLTVCNFLLVYSLRYYNGDAWLFYSCCTVGLGILLGVVQVIRACYLFPECRIVGDYCYNINRLRKVLSFSGWQMLGSIGMLLRGQGSAILLNKYFPPINFPEVNASYSVGNNVANYAQTLSGALSGAFMPEITATEGAGSREKMLQYANQASKMGTYLIMLFAVPLFLELPFVLKTWLHDPPAYASVFCIYILVQFLIDKLTFGLMIGLLAVGKIVGYQIMLGGFLILTLPIAWLMLELGCAATSIGIAFVITMTCCSIGRVFFAKVLIGASAVSWIKEVLVPCAVSFIVLYATGIGVQRMFSAESFSRLLAVGCATTFGWCLAGWYFVLSDQERSFVRGRLHLFLTRKRHR